MRFRTFAWLAAAFAVIAGNTALVLWLRSSRGGEGGPADGWAPRRVDETPVVLLPAPPGPAAAFPAPRVRVVVRAKDAPVAGAAVRVFGDRPGGYSTWPEELLAEGSTGADGIAEIVLPKRTALLVRVAADGFTRDEVRTSGESAESNLHPESVLRVRVLDAASGAPLEGAEVSFRSENRHHSRDLAVERIPDLVTGADGEAAFRGLSWGDGKVRVRCRGRAGAVEQVFIQHRATRTLDVRLAAGASLRGRVVFAGLGRSPSTGQVLHPSSSSAPRSMERNPEPAAALDAEGRFVLDGYPRIPDTAVQLRVEAEGRVYRVQGQRPVVDPATGAQVGEIQVPIPANNPDPGFEGTVTGADGRPVEGALVLLGATLPARLGSWMRGEIFLDEARTDAAGRWRVVPESGPGSASQVLVLHPEFAPTLIAVPSRMRRRVFDAVLVRGASVLVTVRDPEGRPQAGAEVFAQMRSPHGDSAWRDFGDVHGALRAHPRTEPDGSATVAHLGEGSWYLVARSADGQLGARVLVEIPRGEGSSAVEIRTTPLPVARGTVVERSGPRAGEPLRHIAVRVPGETPSEFLSVPVDNNGRFESPPLLAPACTFVDGRVPVFFSWTWAPGELVALAVPGQETEVRLDDPPAPPQAR